MIHEEAAEFINFCRGEAGDLDCIAFSFQLVKLNNVMTNPCQSQKLQQLHRPFVGENLTQLGSVVLHSTFVRHHGELLREKTPQIQRAYRVSFRMFLEVLPERLNFLLAESMLASHLLSLRFSDTRGPWYEVHEGHLRHVSATHLAFKQILQFSRCIALRFFMHHLPHLPELHVFQVPNCTDKFLLIHHAGGVALHQIHQFSHLVVVKIKAHVVHHLKHHVHTDSDIVRELLEGRLRLCHACQSET
mmetsp:Transcript_50958/g.111104  ORF Transcript_50958/g.111104 Transcript_50958/m.111104 type:complete len:246 (+) Transcript_50958:422-1159(+)